MILRLEVGDGLPARWNQDVGLDAASCIGLVQEDSTHDAGAPVRSPAPAVSRPEATVDGARDDQDDEAVRGPSSICPAHMVVMVAFRRLGRTSLTRLNHHTWFPHAGLSPIGHSFNVKRRDQADDSCIGLPNMVTAGL
jgi:hypothetical protein